MNIPKVMLSELIKATWEEQCVVFNLLHPLNKRRSCTLSRFYQQGWERYSVEICIRFGDNLKTNIFRLSRERFSRQSESLEFVSHVCKCERLKNSYNQFHVQPWSLLFVQSLLSLFMSFLFQEKKKIIPGSRTNFSFYYSKFA